MSFEAKYAGRCQACGEPIQVGDLLMVAGTTFVHADCDTSVSETELDRDSTREVCTVCWLLKPCGCES